MRGVWLCTDLLLLCSVCDIEYVDCILLTVKKNHRAVVRMSVEEAYIVHETSEEGRLAVMSARDDLASTSFTSPTSEAA